MTRAATQESLFDVGRVVYPLRRIERGLGETLSKQGSRAFVYQLDCGHDVTRLGSAPVVASVRCKACQPERR